MPGVPVLQDVTLEIEPGRGRRLRRAAPAPGKSTLVDVILGVLDPQQGEVLIGEWPIATVRPRWQRMIGYVPQSIVLFDDTVRANVALGVPPRRGRRGAAAARARRSRSSTTSSGRSPTGSTR